MIRSPDQCPKCGADTRVLETRASKNHLRRARRCQSLTCGHRYGTREIVVLGRNGPSVMVDAEHLRKLRGRIEATFDSLLDLLHDIDELVASETVEDESIPQELGHGTETG